MDIIDQKNVKQEVIDYQKVDGEWYCFGKKLSELNKNESVEYIEQLSRALDALASGNSTQAFIAAEKYNLINNFKLDDQGRIINEAFSGNAEILHKLNLQDHTTSYIGGVLTVNNTTIAPEVIQFVANENNLTVEFYSTEIPSTASMPAVDRNAIEQVTPKDQALPNKEDLGKEEVRLKEQSPPADPEPSPEKHQVSENKVVAKAVSQQIDLEDTALQLTVDHKDSRNIEIANKEQLPQTTNARLEPTLTSNLNEIESIRNNLELELTVNSTRQENQPIPRIKEEVNSIDVAHNSLYANQPTENLEIKNHPFVFIKDQEPLESFTRPPTDTLPTPIQPRINLHLEQEERFPPPTNEMSPPLALPTKLENRDQEPLRPQSTRREDPLIKEVEVNLTTDISPSTTDLKAFVVNSEPQSIHLRHQPTIILTMEQIAEEALVQANFKERSPKIFDLTRERDALERTPSSVNDQPLSDKILIVPERVSEKILLDIKEELGSLIDKGLPLTVLTDSLHQDLKENLASLKEAVEGLTTRPATTSDEQPSLATKILTTAIFETEELATLSDLTSTEQLSLITKILTAALAEAEVLAEQSDLTSTEQISLITTSLTAALAEAEALAEQSDLTSTEQISLITKIITTAITDSEVSGTQTEDTSSEQLLIITRILTTVFSPEELDNSDQLETLKLLLLGGEKEDLLPQLRDQNKFIEHLQSLPPESIAEIKEIIIEFLNEQIKKIGAELLTNEIIFLTLGISSIQPSLTGEVIQNENLVEIIKLLISPLQIDKNRSILPPQAENIEEFLTAILAHSQEFKPEKILVFKKELDLLTSLVSRLKVLKEELPTPIITTIGSQSPLDLSSLGSRSETLLTIGSLQNLKRVLTLNLDNISEKLNLSTLETAQYSKKLPNIINQLISELQDLLLQDSSSENSPVIKNQAKLTLHKFLKIGLFKLLSKQAIWEEEQLIFFMQILLKIKKTEEELTEEDMMWESASAQKATPKEKEDHQDLANHL